MAEEMSDRDKLLQEMEKKKHRLDDMKKNGDTYGIIAYWFNKIFIIVWLTIAVIGIISGANNGFYQTLGVILFWGVVIYLMLLLISKKSKK